MPPRKKGEPQPNAVTLVRLGIRPCPEFRPIWMCRSSFRENGLGDQTIPRLKTTFSDDRLEPASVGIKVSRYQVLRFAVFNRNGSFFKSLSAVLPCSGSAQSAATRWTFRRFERSSAGSLLQFPHFHS